MYVNHKLKMDLAGAAVMPKVDMVQRDQYVRQLILELYCNGEAWPVPEDAHPVICYQKADGTGGEYDTLPDGRRAWIVEGNALTVEVAPQMLTAPGPVRMAVDLLLGDAKLSTFTVMLYVQKAIPLGLPSGDYFKLEGFLSAPKNGEVGQLLRISGVSESGCVTALEGYDLEDAAHAVLEQAKETGAFDGKSAYEVAVDNGFEGTEEAWLESLKGEGMSAILGDIQQINVTGKLTTDSNIHIHFNNSRIRGVRTPVEDSDGANKAYVDQAVALCGAVSVPDYWQTAVEEAVLRVTDLQNLAGRNAVSFAWFSDMHLSPGETSCTGILAADVMDKCHIPFAVFSGDAIAENLTSESTWMEGLQQADAVFRPVGYDRLLQAQGVCDGSRGTDNQIIMSKNQVYGAIFRKQELDRRRIFGGDGSYFYVDDPTAKVRIVILNSCWRQDGTEVLGFGNEQINWLASTALHFPGDGWSLALACHVPPTDRRVCDADALLDVLVALEGNDSFSITAGTEGEDDYISVSGDFSNLPTARILGFFCGCDHKDQILETDQSYKVITITSDADQSADETEAVRIPGTDNEHAIDIVTINTRTGMVNLTRLGVGSSRYYYA